MKIRKRKKEKRKKKKKRREREGTAPSSSGAFRICIKKKENEVKGMLFCLPEPTS